MRLDRRVALVTGAAGGIGEAIALAFAAEGATVVAADINEAGAAETLARIRAGGGDGSSQRVDVTDIADVRRMVADAVAAHGRLDIIANVAGTGFRHSFLEAEPDDFDRVMRVNLAGTFYCGQAAAREMAKRGYGRIINIASIAGNRAGAGRTAYGTSKAAVIGLTRQAALELAPLGITVNAVAPGWVRTEASMRSLKAMAGRADLAEDALLDDIVAHQALPGLMEPDDIAGPYLFLASELAANITGQTLGIDRGEVPW
jgi:NAD(P)-dependent dehydrogenase (short-subunit alcohol dehydrogenase family)